uniref:Uncharacterized protein n=1 Tax=Nelumbo nucifera TaxID=4432 RepID=A0A822YCW2_NELNU|nr:TPA_asm: hypothetical protein HUJ06_030283 [Nelumbo nucifera]
MGGQVIWSCLKYIPHRLAGATLIAPVVNYWWPGFPTNLSKEAFKQQLSGEQWSIGLSHYAPWLTDWWNKQKFLPTSNVIAHNPDILSSQDKEVFHKFEAREAYVAQIRQQGEFESLHRDMIVGFGNWEFDPMDVETRFRIMKVQFTYGMEMKMGLFLLACSALLLESFPGFTTMSLRVQATCFTTLMVCLMPLLRHFYLERNSSQVAFYQAFSPSIVFFFDEFSIGVKV